MSTTPPPINLDTTGMEDSAALERVSSAIRKTKANNLQKTTEVTRTFTEQTNGANLRLFKEELNAEWSAYESAYHQSLEHHVCLDLNLQSLEDEYASLHDSVMAAKVVIAQFIQNPRLLHNQNDTFNDTMDPDRKPFVKFMPFRVHSFSGNTTDWNEFYTTCQTALTPDIPEIQRIQELKRALTGEPRTLIAHIQPVEGVFDQAMALLVSRYDNKRAVFNALVNEFCMLPKLTVESKDKLSCMLITTKKMIAGMVSCLIDTTNWGQLLVFMLTRKLDSNSLARWEEKLQGKTEVPTLTTFYEFLQSRISLLESTSAYASNFAQKPFVPYKKWNANAVVQNNNQFKPREKILLTLKPDYQCPICARNHLANRCQTLTTLSPIERMKLIEKHALCKNCLYNHDTAACPFKSACKQCEEVHHSLLHNANHAERILLNSSDEGPTVNSEFETATNDKTLEERMSAAFELLSQYSGEHFLHAISTVSDQSNNGTRNNRGLLATALVPVRTQTGSVLLKTLIDGGSTTNAITKWACDLLRIQRKATAIPLFGMNNTHIGTVTEKIACDIGSIHDHNYELAISALVVPSISEIGSIDSSIIANWHHLNDLKLADPNFFEYKHIDLLIGAPILAEILEEGLRKGMRGQPVALKTALGWIVFGQVTCPESYQSIHITIEEPALTELMERFWKTEEITVQKHQTADEAKAEEIFVNSLTRCEDGRFMVDLPFKIDPFSDSCFGDSSAIALKRYKAIQRRCIRDPKLGMLHDQCIEEYLSLNHMEIADNNAEQMCILPHHPVLKESSTTTKCRPVFDASAKTQNGFSLNDRLYVGPTIQPDLFTLLIRWRKSKYVFSGDIEKMYRQVRINPRHADFQSIYWQRPGTNEIKRYRLLTPTFGTGSAAYQSIRALHQIGENVKADDPELANMIQRQFYVDDHLGEGDTVEEAKTNRKKITEALASYGFPLRKWKANDMRILEDVPESDREKTLEFTESYKTLGISWQRNADHFLFKSTETIKPSEWTKRMILSQIAKLFDPLGWMAPCVVLAKILMQDLWRLSIDWDHKVPNEIGKRGLSIYDQLCMPIPIHIPRWLGFGKDVQCVEIHGFCDASMLAYAANVYVRIKTADNTATCRLLTAKTKVASVSNKLTLPQLELAGAELLVKLLQRALAALELSDFKLKAWKDSNIVLGWISGHPSRWKTFIANRVSTIQQAFPTEIWSHVPTKQNPACLATRGLLIRQLADSRLWWNGPEFIFE